MSDSYIDEPYGDENEQPSQEGMVPRSQIRQLEKKAKLAEEALARAEAAERRIALLDAGLGTLNPKQVDALLKVHDGDLTPDALKQTATDLGFGLPPTASSTDQVPAAESDAHMAMAEAQAGGEAVVSGERVEADLAYAKSPAEVMAILAKHAPQAIAIQ